MDLCQDTNLRPPVLFNKNVSGDEKGRSEKAIFDQLLGKLFSKKKVQQQSETKDDFKTEKEQRAIKFSDAVIPLSMATFGIVFAVSFLKAEYSVAVHLFGISVGSIIGFSSAWYAFYRIRKPHSVSTYKALVKITAASCLIVANIFYATNFRDLPHDTRVVATKAFSLLYNLNMLKGDKEIKILQPKEGKVLHVKTSKTREGFKYKESDIVYKGFFTFKDKLRYVVVNPHSYNIRIACGESTLNLVKESGAIAGINGSYISKNMSPIGLLIQEGKTLFPYTSENIKIELINGTKLIVPASNYLEKISPFDNLRSIKYAEQLAPNGLVIEDGKIVRDINMAYINELMAQEAIFVVLENGRVLIAPSDYYIKNIYPFDGSVKIANALQTGPLTLYEGNLIEGERMAPEPTRGKVAYAIDTDGNLYLLTTDSIRGIYGMTFTEFTHELIKYGKENGIQFRDIAFGDAGGSGTLTILDEETGSYKISGAGVKYMSSSAILVFPNKTVPIKGAKEEIVDVNTISLKQLVDYSKENPQTLKTIIDQYPQRIEEILLNLNQEEFSIMMDLLINSYLSSFEEAPHKLRNMFINIATKLPERGLMFLDALGPEFVDRVFINYYSGNIISEEAYQQFESIENGILAAFASNPNKAAEFLTSLDEYGVDMSSLPLPLYRLPPGDFDGLDTGFWISKFYGKYNQEALELIDNLDSMNSEVTLAKLFRALIQSYGDKTDIQLLEKLVEHKDIAWVKKYIHITMTQYLPHFEEYYEQFANHIEKTINSVSVPLRKAIEIELRNVGININTVKQKKLDIFKGIGNSTYIVEHTMLRTGIFSIPARDEDPKHELNVLITALKKGEIDNVAQSLYVITAVKDVSLEDKFLALEKLKLLIENGINPRDGVRRISDISLLNTDKILKDSATEYLIALYQANNSTVLKDIRGLLVLASQDKNLKVAERVKKLVLTQMTLAEISNRLQWSHDWPWLDPSVYIRLAQELQKERRIGYFPTLDPANLVKGSLAEESKEPKEPTLKNIDEKRKNRNSL